MNRFPALVLLAVFPAGAAMAQSGYGKSVTFSGLHWLAKVSSAKIGPSNPLIYQSTFNNGVPPTGGENVRMNLWLFQGKAPAGRSSVEIIIDKFEFVPE